MQINKTLNGLADQIDAAIVKYAKDAGKLSVAMEMVAGSMRELAKGCVIPDAPPAAKRNTCSRCRALLHGDGPHCTACQNDIQMLEEKAKRMLEQAEVSEGRMVKVLDGPLADGIDTNISVHPNMPVSTLDAPSYTMIDGHRYKLTKSGLRYAPLSGPGGMIEEANREMSGKR